MDASVPTNHLPRRPAWARAIALLAGPVAAAFIVVVWSAAYWLYCRASDLAGRRPSDLVVLVGGPLLVLRAGYAWRRAAELGRQWVNRPATAAGPG
jgi:hypothetical protein